jgi:peptidoglycan/xylan/chitin deacetylase (PgdA/CDA1 family)
MLTRRQALAALSTLPLVPRCAAAAPCPPDPLGTTRRLPVGTAGGLFVGLKSYPATLPCAEGEFVLTFDDGPWPGTTPRVLDTLACEGVRATFFLIGRNAKARPDLARRIRAEGHTVACHSWSHPWTLRQRSIAAGIEEVEKGFKSIADAIGEEPAPFFRYPGFADTAPLNDWLASRSIGVFGCDFWASDWVPMSPAQELALLSDRMRKAGRGIVLLHDTHAQTAAMLPDFLRLMKSAGKSIVHMVPGSGQGPTVPAPAHWSKAVA